MAKPMGRPPIFGQRQTVHKICLPEGMAKEIKALGEGSLSRGIRRLHDAHKVREKTWSTQDV